MEVQRYDKSEKHVTLQQDPENGLEFQNTRGSCMDVGQHQESMSQAHIPEITLWQQ